MRGSNAGYHGFTFANDHFFRRSAGLGLAARSEVAARLVWV